MPSSTATPALAHVGNSFATFRDASRRIDAEHRLLKAQRLKAAEQMFDDLILQALDEGATVSQIAREMGTSNRTRVYESRNRAIARRAAK